MTWRNNIYIFIYYFNILKNAFFKNSAIITMTYNNNSSNNKQ